MIRECFKTQSGIMFNSQSLFDIGLDPSTVYPVITPRPDALPLQPGDCIRKPPATPIPINIYALSMKKEKQPNLLKDSGSDIPFLGTEEEEELHDAISPKYDQLKIKRFWWTLEIIPFVHAFQQKRDNQGVRIFMYVLFFVVL
jgi:hypothetical protein